MKENYLKKTNGITLIALVVTTVTLVILATVSVNLVVGENGIISKAEQARKIQTSAETGDSETVNTYQQYIVNAVPESESTSGPAGITVAKPSNWTSLGGTAMSDGKGGTVPLPSGFYYVGGDKNTGLVISSKQGDTLTSSGTSMGNQFVWIPVSNVETYFPATNGNTDYTNSVETNSLITGSGDTEYSRIRASITKYGGFYFARYEAGVNSTSLRTGSTSVQNVVSKKGVVPYNHVSWNDAHTAAGNMYSGSVKSTLCYGEQWNAMCAYIGNSSRTWIEQNAAVLTGSVSSDVSKRICDLTTNSGEWTMEEGTSFCGEPIHIIRGGWDYWGNGYSISHKGNTDCEYGYHDTYTNESVGFRVCLYLN